MIRKLATYAAGAVVMLLIAATIFVARRNAAYEASQLAMVTDGRNVRASGIVSAPEPSAKYPFLRHRRVNGRLLGGPGATPDDEAFADAAAEAERLGHGFRRFDPAGDRLVSVEPGAGGTAVVFANASGAPEPLPMALWLTALGGALLSLFIGAWALIPLAAVAAYACGPIAGGIATLIVFGMCLAQSRGWSGQALDALGKHRVAYTYLFPAAATMAVLVIVPFAVGCAIGFFDHAGGHWHFVGFANFAAILGGNGHGLSDPLNFWFTLAVTIAWTAVNVALHVSVGVALALALHQKWLRGRSFLRMLLILPWAVPNYITALIWRGMFQQQFGAVNALLAWLHIPTVAWFSHFASSFAANVVTNTWLGFPFMMVVALGALDSIPRELYEAAAVDGASAWARFRHVTLPGLRPALLPAVVLGSVWTFNMFNVIYLVSGGRPAGATDILVTQAYRWAFERGQRYGMAAAYATLIFLILAGWMWIAGRLSKRAALA